MKLSCRRAAAVFGATAFLVSAAGLPGAPAWAGGFRVQGARIMGPSGRPFVIRGVNVAGLNGPFPYKTASQAHLIADVWKFNTVRVNCNIVPWSGSFHDNDDVDAIVRAYTGHRPNKLVVMFASHDLTGDFYGSGSHHKHPTLGELCAWYTGLARKYRNNPYVWFNVTNEPGALAGNEHKWLVEHQAVIRAIRSTGNLSPIICDAAYWGQDINNDHFDRRDSAIMTLGPQLLAQPAPYNRNIAFSIHLYTEWTRPKNIEPVMRQWFVAANREKLAVIVGEWAWYSWDGATRSTIDVSRAPKAFFAFGPQQGIGRIYWSWFGSDNPLCVQKRDPKHPGQLLHNPQVRGWDDPGGGWEIDRVDGRRPTNLTPAGGVAWADTHR
jgi:hypothetical protein